MRKAILERLRRAQSGTAWTQLFPAVILLSTMLAFKPLAFF